MLVDLEPTISAARLGTYVVHAGHDEARALALYRWNTQLGEAFHLPIQAVEVALRNRINGVLIAKYGSDWWSSATFLKVASKTQKAQIDETKKRITRRAAPMVTGQIVAGLSFGFWVAMLAARFNPDLWSSQLAVALPHLPAGVTRKDAEQHFRAIADFRNRIWHHEPIFKANITKEYSNCMTALGWLCSKKKAWVKPQCVVMAVARMKP